MDEQHIGNDPEGHDLQQTKQEISRTKRKRLSLDFSLWWIVGLLGAVIVGMLLLWHPWSGSDNEARTVTVSGSTVIKAEPDEYSFTPSYEFKDTDKAVALKAVTDKSAEIIPKLKQLGVADKDITSNTGGNNWTYFYDQSSRQYTYTLNLTVKATGREQAQKIQDYLVTTTPTGQISPYVTFSQAKQKQLEQQGRVEASKDARAKADEMAKNLGFKVAKIKSITDQDQYGGVFPMSDLKENRTSTGAADSSLSVQPGENEMTYTVEVVFYIR